MAEMSNLSVTENHAKVTTTLVKKDVAMPPPPPSCGTAAASNTSTNPTVVNNENSTNTTSSNTTASSWLTAHLHVNNNNNALEESSSGGDSKMQNEKETKADKKTAATTKKWNCESCEAAGNVNAAIVVTAATATGTIDHFKCNATTLTTKPNVACASTAQDKGGGSSLAEGVINELLQRNGTIATTPPANRAHIQPMSTLAAIAMPGSLAVTSSPAAGDVEFAVNACGDGDGGAASLTPPDGDCGGVGGGVGINSNRTSVNNSTENLSYSSDNYYPDDLILLDDDDDAEAEEISLNSDDCVYAYRGDGADFDIALDAIAGRNGDADLGDDEPDFLEMDFEPDPLSEIEYAAVEVANKHADAFLLQRDSCHLSGRHSANMCLQGATLHIAQRLLFSSPIDDLPPPKALQSQALQSQALLNKNFARITLHLDQIKSGDSGSSGDACLNDSSNGGCIDFERASVLNISGGDNSGGVSGVSKLPTATAHSLPNTLHGSFRRNVHETSEKPQKSPSKITGAKPKCLSTSSSTSSKNSSKSRTSLRSSFAPPPPALCASSSFDERRVSCTSSVEFRAAIVAANSEECVVSEGGVGSVLPSTSGASVTNVGFDQLSVNDETCLDCLEKEFVASTIGKAMDPNECPKCRKRSGSLSLYKRAEREARCRSDSPAFFTTESRDDCPRFDVVNSDYISTRNKRAGGIGGGVYGSAGKLKISYDVDAVKDVGEGASAELGVASLCLNEGKEVEILNRSGGGGVGALTCYKFNGKLLPFKPSIFPAKPEFVTISTVNLNEAVLVQALDKLKVGYNEKLIKTHFFLEHHPNSVLYKSRREFDNLKQFLLQESKKLCNFPKLKSLIELSTRLQVNVEFKKDTNITHIELIPVKVADILHHWNRNKNLELLKQLDKRFADANVLGKIANIIRQAQQSDAPRQPLPDFISIPQYYPSGYLTLTKNC